MEKNFTEVVKFLAGLGWPFRQHATFDSTASRIMNVLEDVNREVPLKKLRWGLDHCETLTPKTLERVAALGGHVNIQNRMSLDGEAFLAKYGAPSAADAPPIARIREMGIPIACGTDGNRATSYNPWVGVHWLLTGKTLGGAQLQGDKNLLDRTEALRMWTSGGAWMSSEEDKKGTLEAGKLADLVFLSGDYFSMPVDEVKDLESVLTMVGGKVVYAAGPFARLDPPPPPALPDWLPVRHYGGYHKAKIAQSHHPMIISDSGNWSIECSCGGV
jgi:predicted amidohydrolase YtcJ